MLRTLNLICSNKQIPLLPVKGEGTSNVDNVTFLQFFIVRGLLSVGSACCPLDSNIALVPVAKKQESANTYLVLPFVNNCRQICDAG